MRIILITILASLSYVSYSRDSTQTNIDERDSLTTRVEKEKSESIIQKQEAAIDSLSQLLESFKKQNGGLKIEVDNSTQVTVILLVCLIITFLILTFHFMKKKPIKLKDLHRCRRITHSKSSKTFTVQETFRVNPQSWFVVDGSAIGNSHISQNIPCQDASYYMPLKNGWGIAVVCDGAGSAKNSDMGSKYTTHVISKLFSDLIEREGWLLSQKLPNQDEWSLIAREQLKMALSVLNQYALSSELELASLACTVIVVIHSPYGLLVTHIGDGRAGFCDENGEWYSAITPHKGEEANQTVFLTSYSWLKNELLLMSGVNVPESRVINQKVTAFTLMSDGCEQHSFECSRFDTVAEQWSDPNLPYAKFFNPLVSQLKTIANSNKTDLDIKNNWKLFLEEGTKGLKQEPDDKTLILGVLV